MANQKPITEVRIGRVKATVWRNGTDDLQVVPLPRTDAAVYLLQDVVQELDATETRGRQVFTGGR